MCHARAVELEEVEPADEAGAALAAHWKGLLAHVQAVRPLERFRVASVGYRRRVLLWHMLALQRSTDLQAIAAATNQSA